LRVGRTVPHLIILVIVALLALLVSCALILA
jgi:hypothetical protein